MRRLSGKRSPGGTQSTVVDPSDSAITICTHLHAAPERAAPIWRRPRKKELQKVKVGELDSEESDEEGEDGSGSGSGSDTQSAGTMEVKSMPVWLPLNWGTFKYLSKGTFGAITVCGDVAVKAIKMAGCETYKAVDAMREIHALAFFTRRAPHPNVVTALDAWVENKTLHIAMKRFQRSLQSIINRVPEETVEKGEPCLPLEARVSIHVQTLAGLAHIHRWVAHRDVKPLNIVVSGALSDPRSLHAALIDFGQARKIEGAGKCGMPPLSPMKGRGTEGYRAPETFHPADLQARAAGKPFNEKNVAEYGAAVDVFALGCCYAVSVTGEDLFESETGLLEALPRLAGARRRAWVLRRFGRFSHGSGVLNGELSWLSDLLSPIPAERPTAVRAMEELVRQAHLPQYRPMTKVLKTGVKEKYDEPTLKYTSKTAIQQATQEGVQALLAT